MCLKLQKYELAVQYTKGKELYVADTTDNDVEDLEFAVHALIRDLPVSIPSLHSSNLPHNMMRNCRNYTITSLLAGQPMLAMSPSHWKLRHELHRAEKLILLNNRIVIPKVMRRCILRCIHQGHMGIEKSKACARVCVYWPNMYTDIEAMFCV